MHAKPMFGEQRSVVADDEAGARLDAVVHARGLSRRDARRLCELGGVALDGVSARAGERVRAGSTLAWHGATLALTFALDVPVVFADDDALVLCKPAGLAVHAGPLVADSVADRLQRACPGAGLAHRLDRGASGLLLVGRHKDALRALARALEAGEIERRYVAVVAGTMARAEQTIDLPLRATDEPRGDRPKVVADREGGQPARTQVRVRAARTDCTLVELCLETGRTHQIRAHLAAIGHPLLGDPRYGDSAANERARATHGVDRPLLHSARLTFPQPRTGARMDVRAWLPGDIARLFGGWCSGLCGE